jgi:hypothetical protein
MWNNNTVTLASKHQQSIQLLPVTVLGAFTRRAQRDEEV